MYIGFFKNVFRVSGPGSKAFDIHLSCLATVCLLFLDYGLSLESLLWPVGALAVAYGLHEAARGWIAQTALTIPSAQLIYYPFGSVWSAASGGKLFEDKPRSKIILFALSGPLVNLLCGLGCAAFATWVHTYSSVLNEAALTLLSGNVLFGLLCLLPAPGFDGGIVLEQIFRSSDDRPLLKVARFGQAVGVVLCIGSLFFTSLTVFFLGGFIFVSSVKTFLNQSACHSLGDTKAAALMRSITQLDCLEHGTRISAALELAKSSLQDYFPVLHAGELVGVLERSKLITHRVNSPRDDYITALTNDNFLTIAPEDKLATVVNLELVEQNTPLLVVDGKVLQGIIPIRSLIEILIVEGQVSSQLSSSSLDDEADE